MKKELYESSTSSSTIANTPSFAISENSTYLDESFASYDPVTGLPFGINEDTFIMEGWNDDSVA